jgi:hypothetical protein
MMGISAGTSAEVDADGIVAVRVGVDPAHPGQGAVAV